MFDAIFGRSRIPKIHHQSMVPRGYLIAAVITAVILLGLLIQAWFFPFVDVNDPHLSQLSEMKRTIDRQEREIVVLKRENRDIKQRYTKMEHLREIDQESLSRLQGHLKDDQNELLKIEKELAFRKGISSSSSGIGVLNIQRLRLQAGDGENSFNYAFTVNKAQKGDEYFEGFAHLLINGELEGKKSSLPLKQAAASKEGKIKLRFRHFQNIEGKLLFPSGFKPSSVTIEVEPKGGSFKPIKKNYKWVLAK